MKKYFLIGLALLLFSCAVDASAQRIPRMAISVENADSHVQTLAVKRFADALKQRLAGRIDVQFFANARLFRDSDVVQALKQGKVEMAVPGTWNVTQFEPNVGVFLLPFFYGRPAQDTYRFVDGKIGKELQGGIEKNLRVKVLGRWIDLGHAHLFGVNRKIARAEDIRGLRVRVAGGVANKLRVQALGGEPVVVPWPDLPAYMMKGRVDAVLTSYATIVSARLWEKGITSAFEDQEYFPQYIPMIRLSFWNKLPSDIQRIMTETWEKHVDASRREAAEAQQKAKDILVRNGLKVVVPDPQAIKKERERMMPLQDDFIRAMNMDPGFVGKVIDSF